MLQLCAPFLDPAAPLFWKRVDVRYIHQGRLSFTEVRLRVFWRGGGSMGRF